MEDDPWGLDRLPSKAERWIGAGLCAITSLGSLFITVWMVSLMVRSENPASWAAVPFVLAFAFGAVGFALAAHRYLYAEARLPSRRSKRAMGVICVIVGLFFLSMSLILPLSTLTETENLGFVMMGGFTIWFGVRTFRRAASGDDAGG